jgi:hypothetical protein
MASLAKPDARVRCATSNSPLRFPIKGSDCRVRRSLRQPCHLYSLVAQPIALFTRIVEYFWNQETPINAIQNSPTRGCRSCRLVHHSYLELARLMSQGWARAVFMPRTNDKSNTNLCDRRGDTALGTYLILSSSSHKDTAISFAPQQPITQLRSRGGPSGSNDIRFLAFCSAAYHCMMRGYLVKLGTVCRSETYTARYRQFHVFSSNTPAAYM